MAESGFDSDGTYRPRIITSRDLEDIVQEPMTLPLRAGAIVEGTVVKIGRDGVLVDLNYLTEGVIPLHELAVEKDPIPSEILALGERVDVLVVTMGDQEGHLIVSRRRALAERAWPTLEAAKLQNGAVSGKVVEVVNGGLIVDVGLRGFLPASHVELRNVRDLQPYVGRTVDVHIVELDRVRNKVVLSRRDVLRGEMRKTRSDALSRLSPGSIVNGVVSILDFGPRPEPRDVTRELGDIPFQHLGLVGDSTQVRNEFSHFGRGGREKRTYATPDDAADAAALMTDEPSPSLAGSFRAYKCATCEGWHVGHTGARVFVTVDGVDGLVPEEELSWQDFDHPSQIVHIGMEVTAKVLDLDADRGKLVLSIKAVQPEPWGEYARTHAVGQLVYGRVTSLAPFGAFVQIGDAVEGLVHLSEMSTHFVEAPEQVVMPGEELWVKITDINPRIRHIALSIKQAADGGEFAPEYQSQFDVDEDGNWVGGSEAELKAARDKFLGVHGDSGGAYQ